MKKRLIPVVLAVVMLMTLIPFGPAAIAEEVEYTAWFGAQMAPVNGWELGEVAEAKFKLNEETTISIDFGETVNFDDGNYIAIETNVPNPFDGMDMFNEPALAEVLSFKLDGNDVDMEPVFLNAEGKDAIDGSGAGLRLTLANKWAGLDGSVDPATLGDFNTLEITFIVRGVYIARFGAQMDPVDGWGLGRMAETGFVMGQPGIIDIDFGETVSFGDGNYIAIETNLPNPFDDVDMFSDPNMASILSFQLDGNEVEMDDVMINAEGMAAIDGSSTGLRLTLANKWAGIEGPVDPAELGEFQTLRIEFVINYVGDAPEAPPPAAIELQMSGIAYIGGTWAFIDGEHPDGEDGGWWAFEDQAVPIEIGVPFTVSVDMGSEKIKHEYASWDGESYIVAVDTDIASPPAFFDAYIDKILKDGNEINFNEAAVEVGSERGNLRISLTNSWAENDGNPVPISGINPIGEFSKLEVTMVIVELDEPNPFVGGDSAPEPPPTPAPTPTPREPESKGGLPGWVLPVIIAGVAVVIIVVVLVVVKSKKKA